MNLKTVVVALLCTMPCLAWSACDLDSAAKAAQEESLSRAEADNDHVLKTIPQLNAVTPSSTISKPNRQRFQNLATTTVSLRLQDAVESARQRDIEVIVELAALSERIHLKHQDASGNPYLAQLLGNLEQAYPSDSKTPQATTKTCTIDRALSDAQDWAESNVAQAAGAGAEQVAGAKDYIASLNLIRQMNGVSIKRYGYAMHDVPAAARSKDAAAALGKSADAAVQHKALNAEQAALLASWREIDAKIPSEASLQAMHGDVLK